MKKTEAEWNLSPGLGQIQKCDKVQLVILIPFDMKKWLKKPAQICFN
jgi:hypothetical protein